MFAFVLGRGDKAGLVQKERDVWGLFWSLERVKKKGGCYWVIEKGRERVWFCEVMQGGMAIGKERGREIATS